MARWRAGSSCGWYSGSGRKPDEPRLDAARLTQRTIRLADASCFIDPTEGYVRTTFLDGAYCEARVQDGPEHRARAAALGYTTLLAMTLEHDPLHSVLAVLRRFPYSPTLWNVAHGIVDDPVADAEEADVLLLAHWLNDPALPVPFPAGWRSRAQRLLLRGAG